MTTQKIQREQRERLATLRPHKVRDQIVDVMRGYGKPISPTQISRITGGTLGSVAYHVRTLVLAGVVVLAEEGRVRGAVEHFYSLVVDEEVGQLSDPINDLLGLCGALTIPDSDGGYPQPVALEDRARRDLQRVMKRLEPEVRAIASASTARAA